MLKYMESFDHIGGPSTDLSLYTTLGWVWGGAGFGGRAVMIGEGRFGSAALVHNVGAWYPADCTAPVIARKCKKLILGFSVRGANTKIGAYFCYGTHVNFTIVCQVVPTGTMTISMGTGTTTVGSGYQAGGNTPNPLYPAINTAAAIPIPYVAQGDYHFIELYVDMTDYMNGRAKVAVDGRTYYDKQGIVTADYLGFGSNPYDDRANLNKVAFFIGHSINYGYSGQEPIYIDSLYLADDQGGYQDDFLGDIFARTVYPVSDGTKRNWMPYVNGTVIGDENPHHELIDNDPIQPGDETEYLEADQDLTEEMVGFGTNPIPAGSDLIAVNHRTMFRNVASPGSPKMNSLVPLFQMLGNPIVRTDSLSKKLTGWSYGFLDVYYDIVPVSAALWEAYLLEQSEFGFMLRTAENLQVTGEDLMLGDWADCRSLWDETITEEFGVADDCAENPLDLASWDITIEEEFPIMMDGPDCGEFQIEENFDIAEGLIGTADLLRNICTGGTASAISFISAGAESEKAFDGNTGDQWHSGNHSTGVPIWLQYETAGTYHSPDVYRMYKTGAWSPWTWLFQGSNDGTNWTTLDTRTGISFSAGWNTFAVTGASAYSKFRLYVTGHGGYVTLAEMEILAWDTVAM